MLQPILAPWTYRRFEIKTELESSPGILDLSGWPPTLHHHLANINGQQHVYFEG
jgi:hypothetical protein